MEYWGLAVPLISVPLAAVLQFFDSGFERVGGVT